MSEVTDPIIDPMLDEWPWLTGEQIDDLRRLGEQLEHQELQPSLARITARAVRYAVQNGQMQPESVYRDTEQRCQQDPAFHAAVNLLENVAHTHGFTPGELKQIAFKAALNIEMRTARLRPFTKQHPERGTR